MPADQLNLLDLLDGDPPPPVVPPRPSRRRSSSPRPPVGPAAAPAGERVVELRHPEALELLRAHGPDVVAVLYLLAVEAEDEHGGLVATLSTRAVAERLGFLSKDTAHRCLRRLQRAGLITARPPIGPTRPPSYLLHLAHTGLTLTRPSHHRPTP